MAVSVTVVGSIPIRGNEIFNISSLWCRGAALSSSNQHALPPEFSDNGEQSVLIPFSIYPAVCGIQSGAKKKKLFL